MGGGVHPVALTAAPCRAVGRGPPPRCHANALLRDLPLTLPALPAHGCMYAVMYHLQGLTTPRVASLDAPTATAGLPPITSLEEVRRQALPCGSHLRQRPGGSVLPRSAARAGHGQAAVLCTKGTGVGMSRSWCHLALVMKPGGAGTHLGPDVSGCLAHAMRRRHKNQGTPGHLLRLGDAAHACTELYLHNHTPVAWVLCCAVPCSTRNSTSGPLRIPRGSGRTSPASSTGRKR